MTTFLLKVLDPLDSKTQWLVYFLANTPKTGNRPLLDRNIQHDLSDLEKAVDSYAAGLTENVQVAWVYRKLLSKLYAYAKKITQRELARPEVKDSGYLEYATLIPSSRLDCALITSRDIPDFPSEDWSGSDKKEGECPFRQISSNEKERPLAFLPNLLTPRDIFLGAKEEWYQEIDKEFLKYHQAMVRAKGGVRVDEVSESVRKD